MHRKALYPRFRVPAPDFAGRQSASPPPQPRGSTARRKRPRDSGGSQGLGISKSLLSPLSKKTKHGRTSTPSSDGSTDGPTSITPLPDRNVENTSSYDSCPDSFDDAEHYEHLSDFSDDDPTDGRNSTNPVADQLAQSPPPTAPAADRRVNFSTPSRQGGDLEHPSPSVYESVQKAPGWTDQVHVIDTALEDIDSSVGVIKTPADPAARWEILKKWREKTRRIEKSMIKKLGQKTIALAGMNEVDLSILRVKKAESRFSFNAIENLLDAEIGEDAVRKEAFAQGLKAAATLAVAMLGESQEILSRKTEESSRLIINTCIQCALPLIPVVKLGHSSARKVFLSPELHIPISNREIKPQSISAEAVRHLSIMTGHPDIVVGCAEPPLGKTNARVNQMIADFFVDGEAVNEDNVKRVFTSNSVKPKLLVVEAKKFSRGGGLLEHALPQVIGQSLALGYRFRNLLNENEHAIVPWIQTDGDHWIGGLMKRNPSGEGWICLRSKIHKLGAIELPALTDKEPTLTTLSEHQRGLPALMAFKDEARDSKNINDKGFLRLFKMLICWTCVDREKLLNIMDWEN